MRLFMRVVSEVFNPFFTIFYLLFILFSFVPEVSAAVKDAKLQIFLVALAAYLLLPFFLFLVSFRLGLVSLTYLSDRKKRVPIFFLAVLSYFLGTLFVHHFFSAALLPDVFFSLLLASSSVITATFFCNFFWKISMHAAGSAALSGFVFGLCGRYPDNQSLNITFLLCLPFLALVLFSRFYLGRHTLFELLSGAIMGFFLSYLVFFL